MRVLIILVISTIAAQSVVATTYSARELNTVDARRWGLQIIVSRNSSLASQFTVAMNFTHFSRCRVSRALVSMKDENTIYSRYISPTKFGNGQYAIVDESLIRKSAIEMYCETVGTERPGDRYKIKLADYLD